MFLEILQNSQENTCARVSFSIKLQPSGLRPATSLKKETLAQVFSRKFREISKNTFYRTPPVAASNTSIWLEKNNICCSLDERSLPESIIFKWYSTVQTKFWSSRSQMFFKIGVLNNFAHFTGKTALKSHFNKLY